MILKVSNSWIIARFSLLLWVKAARNGRGNGGRDDLGYEENGKVFTFRYFQRVRLNQLNAKELTPT